MKVVVCVKQVPDTAGGVKFNPDGTLDRGAMLTIMNPDDKAGLEAALRLKDQYGAEVTVVTMGLPKAEEVLREAMAMGADKGVLVTDRVLGGADTWATSTTLAGAIRNLEYDLIITGRQAIDGDTAQVGPEIAEHLDYPQVTYGLEAELDGETLKIKKETEDGAEIIGVNMPCLVTFTKPAWDPRYPTIKRKMAANRAKIPTLAPADLESIDLARCGLNGSPTKVKKTFVPQKKSGGIKIQEETTADSARKLYGLMSGAGLI